MKNSVCFFLLIFLVFFELLCLLFVPQILPSKLSSIVLFLSALLPGLFALFTVKNKVLSRSKEKKTDIKTWVIFILCSLGVLFLLQQAFIEIPINIKYSDIIPTVEIYCKRWLSGEHPYSVITQFGYNLYPNYFTLKWFPYVISTYFHFDHRWVAIAGFIGSLLFYLKHLNLLKINKLYRFILIFMPFLFLYLLVIFDKTVFTNTLEILDAGFYIMLSCCIFYRNKWFTATAIILCLLSRFAFLFWLPLAFFILLKEESVSKTLQTAFVVILGVLLFYVCPFILQDMELFSRTIAYYKTAAIGEWVGQSWQQEGAKPHTLFQGIGFASYFYDFANGSIEERLALCKNFHLFISCFTTFLLGVFYWKYRNIYDYKIFTLISLKIYLAVFYHFIQVPYAYLMLVPLFVSVCMLLYVSGYLWEEK